MEFFEMSLAIIVVIVTWIGFKAIIKWIWTLVKRFFSYTVEKLQALTDTDASASLPSSSADRQYKHDVFLSFRGPDTRKSITAELCDQLQRRGIKTFMDDRDLDFGNAISPTLLKAIEESRFAIVVLSRHYASSTWCLEELAKICECMEDQEDQNRILPLFFAVEPSDVRYQNGSFDEAFRKHETSGRHPLKKVRQWRDALNKVAAFRGWNTQDFKTHRKLVDDLVGFVRRKVQPYAIEPTGDFEEYEATTEAMDKVKKALTDDEITAVGVYGMGGVGKTSMVRHVAAQARKTGTFNHWIVAVVSQNPDFRKIQGKLADSLGVKFEEETEDGRAARLHEVIMSREKLLIILDDVWNIIELSTIGIPSYEELQKCRSKVVLTTRRLHVCDSMGSQRSIPLNILSEQDSWKLFLRNAGVAKNKILESTTFEDVARRVGGECRGLPIALIAVARALRDEDMREWETAAQLLEKSQYANPYHEEENAFKCIRLSYDYLKNEDHKSCFLLCCLYPEDHEIEIEDLFRYAIVKGLFRDADSIEEARRTADLVIKYLKNSSLLLDSKEYGCVKMHDVIRDTAIQIAKYEDGHRFLVRAGCGLEDWRPRELHEGCTAISLMRNKIRKLPEEELVCPNLQFLLLKQNADLNEIPENFIKNLNELRLLDLSKTSISVLPQSFSLLTNLQALNLDFRGKLIDISVIGKLRRLEILHMMGYLGEELPTEMGHLTNLRILDVSSAAFLIIPSKVIPMLHKLEELYLMNCGFKDWGSKVEREGEEAELVFPVLSYLKIWLVQILDAKYGHETVVVGRYGHNARNLFLQTTMSTLPNWFNVVTEKTEWLKYDCCEGMSDNIIMEYDRWRLHALKYLKISGSFGELTNLEVLMNTTGRVQEGPVFEKLEELHLMQLNCLKKLCVGELPRGSLSSLKVLLVFLCGMLTNVSKLVQRLPNLEKLYLNRTDELEYVFEYEGFEPKESKLREMHLLGLNSVKSICSGPAPRVMFRGLKILTICRCKLLQSLFASDVAECLVQLEDLFVEQCSLLEGVIEAVNKEKTVLPKLKNLVLKKLPKLYGASATVDIECPSLEHLIVVDCPQFSFSTSDVFESFESVNHISFSNYASDYFGSSNPVKLNDPQVYKFLFDRCKM